MLLVRPLIVLVATFTIACGDDEKGSADTRDTAETVDTVAEPADTASDATANETSGGDTAGAACDPILQTGCETGENCTYIGAETSPTCAPEGPVPANEPCSAESRCQRGVCLSVNQTANYCYQVCGEDTDCGAGTENVCLTLTGAPFKVCKIGGIYQNCNLLTQDCTDAARACYAVANEDEPICLVAGTGGLASECSTVTQCSEGLACVNSVCRALCDPDTAGSCGETATCRDYFDDAGYCAPN